MRKVGISVLLLCLMLLTAACGGEPSGERTAAETVAAETAATASTEKTIAAAEEQTEAETAGETEPSVPEALFLTVSQIQFSVIGEQEDIYNGTVPREQITWRSEDESVIRVEDGVLTATGTGTTQVTASWKDQQVSCTAGCLAKDREELYSLYPDVLRAPKRIPPQVPEDVSAFFADAAMVGDSSTFVFMKLEKGRLGSPQCLCRASLGLYNQVIHRLDPYHKGMDMPIEDVLADVKPGKIFVLLGTNDVRIYSAEEMIGWLEELLNRIQEKNPEIEIYLQSLFPFGNDQYLFNSVNENVFAYNELLEKFAGEHGHHYVPITPYLVDHIPGFVLTYQQDEFHPGEKGVDIWVDALKAYAYGEKLKGEWS